MWYFEASFAMASVSSLLKAARSAADHWARARALLAGGAGPGATERLLARVALEWAAAAPRPATDALFALRPSAWVAVEAGGADALTRSLLAAAAGDVPPPPGTD